jgi:uncharacterized RDD family membrane protein YckC
MHTLMLALFLILEASGFRMPVGSSLFWFTWIAVWMTHGLALVLTHIRDREAAEGDLTAQSRFWRHLVLAAHSALYVAFGPLVILWWLVARTPGPQQQGEGQGLWIYPVWLMVLLAHGAYVMMRDRQTVASKPAQKRKRDVPSLKRLMEVDADDAMVCEDDDFDPKNKRQGRL